MHAVRTRRLFPPAPFKDDRCTFLKRHDHRVARRAWKQQINLELFELEGDIPLTEEELQAERERELKADLDRYYEDLFWEDEAYDRMFEYESPTMTEEEECRAMEEECRAMEEAYRQLDEDEAREREIMSIINDDRLTKESKNGS